MRLLHLLLLFGSALTLSESARGNEFKRTRVVGFSQVGQTNGGWFVAGGVFESIVGNDRWELLWGDGAGVDRWRNPDYEGWARALVSPCPGEDAPDRVLLSISGPYGDDTKAWTDAIDATVAVIQQKLPSVRRIILQAVVGGPGGKPCSSATASRKSASDGRVRASWQHAHIVEAIHAVTQKRNGMSVSVVAGFQPTVRTCGDYIDALGHLTPEGAAAVGRAIGEYYAKQDALAAR
jgi:hypothetical protein